MDKKDKEYILEGTIKGLITFIPVIGGLIGSLLSDTLADRKEQRLNDFLKDMKDAIDENKERLNSDFISKVDFLDVFEATTNKIANERSDEKRSAFKNILLNGILSPNYTYDDIENQMRILDQLNADHILLLKFFKSPKTFNSEAAQINSGTYLGFFRALLPNWEFDYLKDHLNDLEINRLIENLTGNMQTMMTRVSIDNFTGTLTSRGATFASFILR
jgi:cadmium resistance protein CadD (predicted permease)